MRRLCGVSVFAVFLLGSVASAPADPITGGNNRAVINGESIPGGNLETIKAVEVSLVTASDVDGLSMVDGFVVGDATAYRYMLRMRNDSERGHCFVQTTLQMRDADGNDLVADTTFVDGSVADMGSDIFTSSCLAPGETGYVAGIRIDEHFDALAAIEVAVDDSNTSGQDPATSVIPVSYSLTDGNVEVTVENQGEESASLGGGFHKLFFLNGDGEPIYWTLFDEVATATLGAGESAVLTVDPYFVSGTVSSVEVLVDFGAP